MRTRVTPFPQPWRGAPVGSARSRLLGARMLPCRHRPGPGCFGVLYKVGTRRCRRSAMRCEFLFSTDVRQNVGTLSTATWRHFMNVRSACPLCPVWGWGSSQYRQSLAVPYHVVKPRPQVYCSYVRNGGRRREELLGTRNSALHGHVSAASS